ncbi:AraC family transcriptional regulator [Leucobacter sp. CSA1]|uniref:AraC family transcriptional regulator n=1 Tax=Leucobacter chromiisoli TaxID=2796471 RepID=A0A934Q7Z6_9MICO|nr:AraC family transcriptional regulator [Leucobacter chromiisoli]MBK0419471.1 AraC family transcriptional regulator [Leucobacter chromiisoli]
MRQAKSQSAVFGVSEIQLRLLPAGHRVLLGSPHRLDSRSQEQLRLHVVRQGELLIESNGNRRALTAGDAVFLLSSTPIELRSETGCELLTIAVPSEVVGEARGVWPHSGIQPVSQTSMLLLPVAAFAARALSEAVGSVSGFTSYYVERLLQEMLQGLLVDSYRPEHMPSAQTQSTFPLAMSVIEAQHSDPELTAAAVAEEVNISLRQLEREFRKNGTTIRQELRRVRVEQARRMLGDPDYDGLSVGQIAQFVGFSGGSSLARAMSATGMPSPSAVRC